MIIFIYSTFAKSYLDPLMGQNWELLGTELRHNTSSLFLRHVFFEQFILLSQYNLDCCLSFPLTRRQFVVSYLRLIQWIRQDLEILQVQRASLLEAILGRELSKTLHHTYYGMTRYYKLKTIRRQIGIYYSPHTTHTLKILQQFSIIYVFLSIHIRIYSGSIICNCMNVMEHLTQNRRDI